MLRRHNQITRDTVSPITSAGLNDQGNLSCRCTRSGPGGDGGSERPGQECRRSEVAAAFRCWCVILHGSTSTQPRRCLGLPGGLSYTFLILFSSVLIKGGVFSRGSAAQETHRSLARGKNNFWPELKTLFAWLHTRCIIHSNRDRQVIK